MSDNENINVGDLVDVFFEHVRPEEDMVVLHKPTSTGDSWRLSRGCGTVVLVNHFSKMVKKGGYK